MVGRSPGLQPGLSGRRGRPCLAAAGHSPCLNQASASHIVACFAWASRDAAYTGLAEPFP